MQFFDAHTHSLTHAEHTTAIYNLRLDEQPIEAPAVGYFSVGIHPYDVHKATQRWIDRLYELAHNERCIAIGETGIDRSVDNIAEQTAIFAQHCALAEQLQKPIIIHCVRAQSEILAASSKVSVARIFHSYSKVNAEISRAQNIIYSLSPRNISQWAQVDIDQILLETDDSTTSIEYLYAQFAFDRKMSINEVSRVIGQNFFRIFAR